MTPLTPNERMRRLAPDGRPMRRVAAGFIKPNDRLTSFERLEIYNRQYWFRILSGFAEALPGFAPFRAAASTLFPRPFEAVSFQLLLSRSGSRSILCALTPLAGRPPKIVVYGPPGSGRY